MLPCSGVPCAMPVLGGALGPRSFGPLLYAYSPEGALTDLGQVLVIDPDEGTPGPSLDAGGGTPALGPWDAGTQQDIRGGTAGDGRSGSWTRPTAVGDYTIACAFQRIEATAGRLFIVRRGAVSAYDTNHVGALSVMGDGSLYWYVTPTGTAFTGQGGAVALGTRHTAIIRRVGSIASVYLDGGLLSMGDVGAAAIPSQVESIHYLDDPMFSQAGRHALRALYMWSSAVDVAAVHSWMRAKFGTV